MTGREKEALGSGIRPKGRSKLWDTSEETFSCSCPACQKRIRNVHAIWYDWTEKWESGQSGGWVVNCPNCGARLEVQPKRQKQLRNAKISKKQSAQKAFSFSRPLFSIVLAALLLVSCALLKGTDILSVFLKNESQYNPFASLYAQSSIPDGFGNSDINISEGGMMVSDGSYLYYTNPEDYYRIYRTETPTQSGECICDIPAFYLNYRNGFLYFGGAEENQQYLYELDLTKETVTILSTQNVYEPKLVDHCIYYEDADDEYSLWCYDLSSGQQNRICDGTVLYCCVTDDAFYYIDTWDDYRVYSIQRDGANKRVLFDGVRCRELCIVDGILYCSLRDGGISIKEPGDDSLKRISDISVRSMNVSGDWIYFSNEEQKSRLYKMRTDGSEVTKLSNHSAELINVYGDLIAFKEKSQNKFYWCGIDGSNLLQIK